MELNVARIIIFAKQMDVMIAFYEDVLGLTRVNTPDDSADFVSFDAGGAQLALHRIPKKYAKDIKIDNPPVARQNTPIKVAFAAADVKATRAELRARGATMGSVQASGGIELCDGVDPEGNVFQISNRGVRKSTS